MAVDEWIMIVEHCWNYIGKESRRKFCIISTFSNHKPHTDVRGFEIRPQPWLDAGYRNLQTRCQILVIICPEYWMSKKLLGDSHSSFQHLTVSATARNSKLDKNRGSGHNDICWEVLRKPKQTQNLPYLKSVFLTVEIPKMADYWSLVYGYRRFGEIFSKVIHSVMNITSL